MLFLATSASPPPDDPETLKVLLAEERAENERLRQIIQAMQRHRFGRRAESLQEDQLLLGLEEAEQGGAATLAATDSEPANRATRVAERRRNRGTRPAHLPRIERVVWDCPGSVVLARFAWMAVDRLGPMMV
jgi:transposase